MKTSLFNSHNSNYYFEPSLSKRNDYTGPIKVIDNNYINDSSPFDRSNITMSKSKINDNFYQVLEDEPDIQIRTDARMKINVESPSPIKINSKDIDMEITSGSPVKLTHTRLNNSK